MVRLLCIFSFLCSYSLLFLFPSLSNSITCNSPCSTCASNNPSKCNSCLEGYSLANFRCVSTTCPDGKYFDTNLNICKNCDRTCATCFDGSNTNCLSCASNEFLYNYVCYTTCPQGTLSNNMGVCVNCNSSCLACDIIIDNCTSCFQPLSLSKINDLGICSNVNSNCANHEFLDNGGQCQACSINCNYCDKISDNCTACYGGLMLIDDGNGGFYCGCGSSQYVDALGEECIDCNANCLTCSLSFDNCTSCYGNLNLFQTPDNKGYCRCMDGFYLDSSGVNCVACAQDEYFNISLNQCIKCDANCLTCRNSSTNCTSCVANLNIFEKDGKSVCDCLDGLFLNETVMTCLKCDEKCLTCNNTSTNCSSCPSNLLFDSPKVSNSFIGDCVCSTNSFYNSQTKKCEQCDISCQECYGSSSSECFKCATNYQMFSNKCVISCNQTQYYNETTETCQNCSQECYSCSSESICLSCKTNTHLKNESCVPSCGNNYYLDATNNECKPCDPTCFNCNNANDYSCISCFINNFLYNSQCLANCPEGYFANITTNVCEKIITQKVYAALTEIDNPYKFLLVFFSISPFSMTIQKSIKQELDLNISITIKDNRTFEYSLLPSGINSTSFLLQLNYFNSENLKSVSEMSIIIEKYDNPYFELINDNMSIELNFPHQCTQNTEYYDAKTDQCVKTTQIDYTWSYGDATNVIVIQFNTLNEKIKNSLTGNESLLIISIDNLQKNSDYTTKLSNISNNNNQFNLIIKYNSSLVGGALLHLSYNQSQYNNIALENKTLYLVYRKYDIALQDYYILSESEQKNINNSAQIAKSGSDASIATVLTSMFFFPGSSFAIRGLMLMNVIQLLKYVDIAYPPNAVSIFRQENSKMFFDEKFISENNENLPDSFQFYKISISPINNLFDDYFQILLFTNIGYLIIFLNKASEKFKKYKVLDYIMNSLKATFVWSLVLMLLISKYLKNAVSSLVFLRYKVDYLESIEDLIFFLFCFVYTIFLIPHIALLLTKIKYFQEDKFNDKSQVSSSTTYLCASTMQKHDNNKIVPVKNDENPQEIQSLNHEKFENSESSNKNVDKDNQNSSEKKSNDDLNLLKFSAAPFFTNINSNKSKVFPVNPFFYDTEKPRKKEESIDSSSYSPVAYRKNMVKINELSKKQLISQLNQRHKSIDWAHANNLINSNDSEKHELNPEENLEINDFIHEPATAVPNFMAEIQQIPPVPATSDGKTEDLHAKVKFSKEISPFEIPQKNNEDHNINKIKPNVWGKYGEIFCRGFSCPFICLKRAALKMYSNSDQKEFRFKYRILLKGLNEKSQVSRYYFVIDLTRFLLLATFITLLYDYPLVQMCFLSIICFGFLLYVLIVRPFAHKIDKMICFMNEILINCAYFSALVLAWMDKVGNNETYLRMQLGWAIVFSYLVLMYSLLMNVLQKMIRSLWAKSYAFCSKFKKK